MAESYGVMLLHKEAQFLTFIQEKTTENNQVSIDLILDSTKLSNAQVAKILWKLFIQAKIDVFKKRHETNEVYLAPKKLSVSKKRNACDSIQELIGSILLCSRLLNIKKITEFNRLTDHRYQDQLLLQFLQSCGPEFSALKIVCKYLAAFFCGESHLTILDLGLHLDDIIEISEKLNQNTFIPQTQQLIEIRKEKGGYYLDAVLKPRMIKLLKNEPVPLLPKPQQKNYGLYELIKWEDIEVCKLYYNKQEQMLFENVSKLVNAIKLDLHHSLSILLHGVSGTGKTEFVYQLARTVQVDVMQLNFSEIQSKWIGDTEKNIREVFNLYQEKRAESSTPLLLLINEADGVMNRRVNVNVSNDAFHNQAQTQFLETLEHFKGTLIATTNLYQNIDEAFHRRFLFQQEITIPDRNTRELILNNSTFNHLIPEELQHTIIQSEWSPAQIKNIDRKIKQLQTIQKIDQQLVEWLFIQDGLLQKKRKLGFMQQNSEKEFSKKASTTFIAMEN